MGMNMTTLKLELTYRIARRLAQLGGFGVQYPRFVYLDELAALNTEWQRDTGSTDKLYEAHYVLYSLARSVANLPGDTVECGVRRGRGSYAICWASPDKLHHAFDSWEGLSAPQAADIPTAPHTNGWKAGDLATPMEIAQVNLTRFSSIRLYKGWIPERFHEVANRRFCLVHIDVDLYEPTLESLQFFYPRLVPGGVLIYDDYGATISPGSKLAFDKFIADKPERSVVHLPTGQGLIVKRE
jgi:hypothetical protein